MVGYGIAVLAVVVATVIVVVVLRRCRARERLAMLSQATSERRFQQLFHASPVALSLSRIGDDRRVLEVNGAYLTTFGRRRSEIIGRAPQDGVIDVAARAEPIERDVVVDTPRGKRVIMSWSRTVDLDGAPHALSTFIDVTEHRRAEEAARASDERVRELAENVQEMFWLTDPHNRTMLYISPSYEKVFGRTCAALYADPRDWLAAIHPDDRERMRATTETICEARWEDEYRIIRPDGAVRTIHVAVSPIRDASGTIVRLAGVGEDVTDRIALELQVRQTQKLESLGLLAGGIAHDFNNVLGVIAANADLLGETVPTTGEPRELVDEIALAVRRATAMTRQLLAFSRKQLVEPVVLDLNDAVGDTRKMLRRMVGEDISIVTSLEPDLGRVLIDPGYLVQVIMNLTVNARDAMPRGGTLTLTTRNMRSTREVMMSIADTGCGMSDEVKARIFEPFFTTKDVGRGTGLGLSVVHGIVEQAGGRIEVESELGVGTTLKIYFPLVDAPAEKIADVASVGASGTEKILVVDDDMFVRTATSRALRARGYQVLEASDGVGALRMLRDDTNVDLLVTDVVMPGVDGRELVEAARARRPSLKVLYISGYADDAVLHHGVKSAEVAILEKPFRAHMLAGRIRQILDAA
jgi:PAS domain S-box-containing protein